MMRIRRSWVLPRLLFTAAWVLAPISTRLAGAAASVLWFVPWQRHPQRDRSPQSSGAQTTVEVDGQRLVGTVTGHGPTVLLIHGWSDSSWALQEYSEPLVEAGYRVVAIDLPAHGASTGTWTFGPMLARAVTQLSRQFKARAVIAHSLGAHATTMALRDGLKLERVVLLSPAVRAEQVLATFITTYRVPRRAIEGLRRVIERRFGAEVWNDLAVDRAAHDLDVPALIVHDVDDRLFEFAEARRLATAWQGAELVETTGLGHRRLLHDSTVMHQVVSFLTEGPVRQDHRTVDHGVL